jgi:hypothetical protein
MSSQVIMVVPIVGPVQNWLYVGNNDTEDGYALVKFNSGKKLIWNTVATAKSNLPKLETLFGVKLKVLRDPLWV